LKREGVINDMTKKLKRTLTRIEQELVVTSEQIEKLSAEARTLFDVPELQIYRYDLRVVFVHDGLFGRKQVYSYVYDKGSWWKTADNEVTQVSEETVFTDPTGMHLGAGPYMLIYSRALTPEEQGQYDAADFGWPDLLQNSIQHNNDVFLDELPIEIQARFRTNADHPPDASEITSYDVEMDSKPIETEARRQPDAGLGE